jgi:hypothetical protein
MTTESAAPQPPPLTTAEALDGQRKDIAKLLRRLADQCEAGRLPVFGGAYIEICENCSDPHPLTVSYTEDQTTTGYLTLGGLCDMLLDGVRQSIKSTAFHNMLNRVRAMHEAQQATKQ